MINGKDRMPRSGWNKILKKYNEKSVNKVNEIWILKYHIKKLLNIDKNEEKVIRQHGIDESPQKPTSSKNRIKQNKSDLNN